MSDRLVLIFLGVWAVLFGITSITNLDIVWSRPLMGFAALILGVICLIRALK